MASAGESFQGKLLLDSGKLAGSYFDRAVILICKHNDSGTFGLLLNRPNHSTLGSSIAEGLSAAVSSIPLLTGGPVQPTALSFLQQTEPQSAYDILPDVRLGHSLDEVKQNFMLEGSALRVRAYVGYAGWAAGQLEEEMKTGCWLTHGATLSIIFSPQPQSLWQNILKEKGGIHRLTASFPDDPSRN